MELEEIKNKIKSKTKDMECPVFRGQANAKCMLNSGAIRRLVKACGYDFILWKNKTKKHTG